MKACYAQQMRRVDRDASQIAGIPSIVLMENAAIACVDELKKDFKDISEKKILIFCGKGNNGGDGFAIARHLTLIGASVTVYPISGTEYKGDALINYDISEKLGCVRDFVFDEERLSYEIKAADIIIDAIYGTGIHGTVREDGYNVISLINDNAKYVMSVDIPSGVNADTGEVCGICVHADKTVTFAAWKLGMLLYPGADYTGEVVCSDISIPEYIINMDKELIEVIDKGYSPKKLFVRNKNSQKGDYGKIFIIAGSIGLSGAAYMSSQSAMYAGAGLVTLGVCESIAAAMEAKTTEVMTLPLRDLDGHITITAEPEILTQMDKADIILIGPGIGRSRDAARIVKDVLKESKVPVIVDADALYAVAQDTDMLRNCDCPLILTPHEMEMARLIGTNVDYVKNNRIKVSKEFCEKYGVTLILKGSHTIVAAPDGMQYINITGNPGMATGGSGDVLAGITAAFAARVENETIAAAAAVRVHGLAGDYAAEMYGKDGMTAVDIMNAVKNVLKDENEK